jgi:hypothetical protein
MNLKPIHLQLKTEEVAQILRIAMDDDTESALDFIKTVLAKRVEKSLQRH